ncbi:MAG: hypothetical protein ACOYNB_08690 [Aquabacterium sp.]|uniref:hypothetical protein n=1 Tax=Aquabacterium sp. TaxID=1872578 RepID=UPI003BD58826
MAQCVAFVLVNGVTVLSPVEATPCTTAVVLTPAEYELMASNPFRLGVDEAALLASAVLGVWGIGYCWRSIRKLSGGNEE